MDGFLFQGYSLIRDSSVGIATGYGPDGRGSISGRGKRFSLLHCVQTGSGAYPASYPMGTWGKPVGARRCHSPPSAEDKNGGAGQLFLSLLKFTIDVPYYTQFYYDFVGNWNSKFHML
jgi:hypothetical protein